MKTGIFYRSSRFLDSAFFGNCYCRDYRLVMLPVDQYPQITPPVVKISASYPGASAMTVSQAVATPIEQELNGTPGMIYMQAVALIREV